MVYRRIACLALLCLMLSGCYHEEELGNVNIVTGILLDYSFPEQNYILICEIAVFEGYEKSSNLKSEFLKASGKTVSQAFVHLKQSSEKEIYFSHAKVLVLGENFQKIPLKNIIEYCINHPELNSDILLCMSGFPHENLEQTEEKPFFPIIYDFFKNDNSVPKLYELYEKKNFSLPEIRFLDNTISITNTALFSENIYIETLQDEENFVFKLLNAKLSQESFSVDTADFFITSGKSKFFHKKDNTIVDISLTLELTDSKTDISQASFRKWKHAIEQQLTDAVNRFTKRLQQENKLEFLTGHKNTDMPEYRFHIKISHAGTLNEF